MPLTLAGSRLPDQQYCAPSSSDPAWSAKTMGCRDGRQLVHRRADDAGAVAEPHGRLVGTLHRRAHRGHPWFGVADHSGHAVVAGRRGDEDAGEVRVEEGVPDRAVGLVVAHRVADRVVDDLDTVGHRRVDRRDDVGVRARAAPKGLVHGDPRVGRHSGDRAVVVPEDHRVLDGKTRRGGGGVGAVSVHVSRREGLPVGERAVGAEPPVGEVSGADDLAVAGAGGEALTGLASAVPARRPRHGGGEGGALRPDAGVDHADDHIGAVSRLGLRRGLRSPTRRRLCRGLRRLRCPGRRRVGLHETGRGDRRDARVLGEFAGLRAGQLGGEAVEGGGVGPLRPYAEVAEHVALRLAQVLAVLLGRGRMRLEFLPGHRPRGRESLDSARVRRDRRLSQPHDVLALDGSGLRGGVQGATAREGGSGVVVLAQPQVRQRSAGLCRGRPDVPQAAEYGGENSDCRRRDDAASSSSKARARDHESPPMKLTV